MNIHELIDILDAWVSRGSNKAYSFMVYTGEPTRCVFLHLRPGRCIILDEHSSILRLL